MPISVLIVDDSGFFRRRLKELIDSCPDLKVVGAASNGREAIELVQKLNPDVITMDYEMPVMDGITAVRHIMASKPTPILMFSSLTYEGARVTLDSLDAGAVDYLPKNFEEISSNSADLKKKLTERIIAVARSRRSALGGAAPSPTKASSTTPSPTARDVPKPAATASVARAAPTIQRASPPVQRRNKPFKLIAIGTSTGGPVALQTVLTKLPASYPVPILLIQHMPASFTPAFAERLNSLCRIEVREAADGDDLRPGLALLAPGGKQMLVDKRGKVRILPGDERLNYKPSVDVTFGSAANVYPDGVLAVVLTGMGSDGREGARLLKGAGSTIWAQDEATSVIYGMPMAVAKADLADEILALDDISERLKELV